MQTAAPTIKLNSGFSMPLMGFGTWKAEPGQVGAAVHLALQNGYRHIDCAAVYCNEPEIGVVFEKDFGPNGICKREDVFITSKLWNTCHEPARVREACLQTLKDLRLDYLDLYLVHWPYSHKFAGLPITPESVFVMDGPNFVLGSTPLYQTWQAMEQLVKDGLVRSIGVSNYTVCSICDLMTYAQIKPAVNQVESHPYNNRAELRAVCENWFGIHVTAYSPLGGGRVGPLQDHDTVAPIAAAHGRTPAQIILAWAMHRGMSVIPKSVTEARIVQNFRAIEVRLSEDELTQIDALDRKQVVCDMRDYWPNKFPADA